MVMNVAGAIPKDFMLLAIQFLIYLVTCTS